MQGKWIWMEDEYSSENERICFMTKFAAPETEIKSCVLNIAAVTKYAIYVNGIYVGNGPIRSTKWESFFDVIEEGKTGIGYEFDNQKELEKTLEEISSTPRTIIEKKYKCIEKAKEYLPRVAIRSLLERL